MERLLTIRDVEQLTGPKSLRCTHSLSVGRRFPKPIDIRGRSEPMAPQVRSVTGFTRRFKEVAQSIELKEVV